eukprot:TRINITY_DN36561_c0_g1_i2.p1 TRINITY_DN36561_c0_g1~~TRINITY_DN36561_c0_g1_i2.p1  ORF type:complete len:412 (-),score=78.65 TRINITY_DN36561_c0_g1_i2:179-1414(-)
MNDHAGYPSRSVIDMLLDPRWRCSEDPAEKLTVSQLLRMLSRCLQGGQEELLGHFIHHLLRNGCCEVPLKCSWMEWQAIVDDFSQPKPRMPNAAVSSRAEPPARRRNQNQWVKESSSGCSSESTAASSCTLQQALEGGGERDLVELRLRRRSAEQLAPISPPPEASDESSGLRQAALSPEPPVGPSLGMQDQRAALRQRKAEAWAKAQKPACFSDTSIETAGSGRAGDVEELSEAASQRSGSMEVEAVVAFQQQQVPRTPMPPPVPLQDNRWRSGRPIPGRRGHLPSSRSGFSSDADGALSAASNVEDAAVVTGSASCRKDSPGRDNGGIAPPKSVRVFRMKAAGLMESLEASMHNASNSDFMSGAESDEEQAGSQQEEPFFSRLAHKAEQEAADDHTIICDNRGPIIPRR